MRRLFWISAVGLIAIIAIVVVTGTSLIPPSLWLGPCLYDWTSGNSYQPRASPLGQLRFSAGSLNGELCYGRPFARGRAIYGALVPYHSPWRLGANEPTRLYLDRSASVAGITLPSGRYSLYVEPDSAVWTLFVTRSVLHWGNDISPAVRSQEVGHASLSVAALSRPVEQFTATASTVGDTAWLAFDWAGTRLAVPVVPLQ